MSPVWIRLGLQLVVWPARREAARQEPPVGRFEVLALAKQVHFQLAVAPVPTVQLEWGFLVLAPLLARQVVPPLAWQVAQGLVLPLLVDLSWAVPVVRCCFAIHWQAATPSACFQHACCVDGLTILAEPLPERAWSEDLAMQWVGYH